MVDEYGKTLFHVAAAQNSAFLPVLLGIKSIQDQLNNTNSSGDTVLHTLILRGDVTSLDRVLSNGVNVNVELSNGRFTPLGYAALLGKKSCADLLKKFGTRK